MDQAAASTAAAAPARGRMRALVWSIPNQLTYARILAVPALALCLTVSHGVIAHAIATVIFAAAAVTDFFDGYLARAWSQQSPLGRMLDPIADKLLVAVAILMLAAEGIIGGVSLFAGVIILCRELLVSGLREYLAELKVGVPVSLLAKWKTAMQLAALSLLIASPVLAPFIPRITLLGLGLFWAAALLTIWTGYDYLRASVGHAIEDPDPPET